MLLGRPQSTGQSPAQRLIQPRTSTVPKLRKADQAWRNECKVHGELFEEKRDRTCRNGDQEKEDLQNPQSQQEEGRLFTLESW